MIEVKFVIGGRVSGWGTKGSLWWLLGHICWEVVPYT